MNANNSLFASDDGGELQLENELAVELPPPQPDEATRATGAKGRGIRQELRVLPRQS